ncbi:MAG: hypothetical protein AB8G15_07170 [Saprospiraceae bacterium]
MKKISRSLLFMTTLLLVCTSTYAGELAGLDKALDMILFSGISFIIIFGMLFLIFRKDYKFLLFTVLNLIVFFFVLLTALNSGENGFIEYLFVGIAWLQVIAQVIAVIMAANRRRKAIQE